MNWLQSLLSVFRRPVPPAVTPPPPLPVPVTGEGGGGPTEAEFDAMADAAKEAMSGLNDARRGSGMRSLWWDYNAEEIVVHWAHVQADRRDIGHDGAAVRIRACGYSAGGECVGVRPTGEAMAAAWLASPPHRAIVLNPAYDRAGVGAARGADGQVYWCLIAGRKGA